MNATRSMRTLLAACLLATIAPALGRKPEDMHMKVLVGVPKPQLVDTAAVAEVLPYGTREVEVVEGGLEIMNDEGTNLTVIANAAAVVYLDMETK